MRRRSRPDPLLEPAWAIAREAVSRGEAPAVLAGLPERTRGLLLDGGGDPAHAADLLRAHAAEALVAEQVLLRWCGEQRTAPVQIDDPATRLLATLPGRTLRAARGTIASHLGAAAGPPAAESLFPCSFSTRAKKRRGGVYTSRAVVDRLLDLVGWSGDGAFLEPAVGAGAFLLRAWERGLEAGRDPALLREQLQAVDLHPFACRAARTGLALQAARLGVAPEHVPRVQQGDALVAPPPAPTAALGRYRFVLGNPPYVRGERVPPELRSRYRALHPGLGPGNVDLAAYFVRRAFEWLAPGGVLGFVITQGLLEARSSAGLRAFLAGHTLEAVVSLEWGDQGFEDAAVIPCLLVVRNAPPPARHDVVLSQTRVRQATWLGLGKGRWPLALARGDVGFLRRLSRAPTPLKAGYGLAIRTRTGAPKLVAPGPQPPPHFTRPRPLLDGREVRAWTIDSEGRWIDYRVDAISDPKTEAFFAAPKVLLARIALTPQAAVDDGDPEPFLARNTVMVVRAPGTLLDDQPHALAAVINSLPVRVFAFLVLRAGVLAGSHRATFYAGIVGELPVPAPLLEDPARARRLARRARQARDLAREGRLSELARVEAEIDALVAEAFGLTPAQLARLRQRATAEPLRTILNPVRAGQPTRRIGVQSYVAGQRYA